MKRIAANARLSLCVMGALIGQKGHAYIAEPSPSEDLWPRHQLFQFSEEEEAQKNVRKAFRSSHENVSGSFLAGAVFGSIKVDTTSSEEMISATKRLIADNTDIFQIDPQDTEAILSSVVVGGDFASISYHVSRNGLRVQDGALVFRFKKGQLANVENRTFGTAPVAETKALSSETLRQSLEKHFPVKSSVFSHDLYRVTAHPVHGLELVQVAVFIVDMGEKSFELQVDRGSGSVFAARSTAYSAVSGKMRAKMHLRNYKDEASFVSLTDLFISKDKQATDAEGNFTLQNPADFILKGLSGRYVNVVNRSGDVIEKKLSESDGEGTLTLTPRDISEDRLGRSKGMAQLMAYNNVTLVVRTAERYSKTPFFSKAINVNVNKSRMTNCNAFYLPSDKSLNFLNHFNNFGIPLLPSCVNSAVVSDIAFHEWGHAYHDGTSGIDDGGLSEGYGDAVALAMTHNPKLGEHFIEGRDAVRNAEDVVKYPPSSTEAHEVGRTLAGAMWELFKNLKLSKNEAFATEHYNKIVFNMIQSTLKITDAYKTVLTIDDDNASLDDGTPNFCAINKAFASRGFAELDGSCK